MKIPVAAPGPPTTISWFAKIAATETQMPTSRGPISTAGKFSYAISLLLFLLVGSTLCSCIFGGVVGTEFNPYTFQSRQFSYMELPIVGLQVWPTTRTPSSNELQDWITTDANVLVDTTESRWDLVDGMRASRIAGVGNSSTLHEYLTSADSNGDLVWLKWSREHPKQARKFWPAIAWLAQQELYYLIPDVIEVAKGSFPSVDSFQVALEEKLREHVLVAIGKIREADEPERASKLEAMLHARVWRELEREASASESTEKPPKRKGKASESSKLNPDLPAEALDPGA